MLPLLQHDILMCKMFIFTFKCVSEAAGPPWLQDLALNLVGIVALADESRLNLTVSLVELLVLVWH